MCASGNAHVTADTEIDVVGMISRSGNATISPNPTVGASYLSDPLAYLTPPTNPYPSGCTNDVSVSANNTLTIGPGCYDSVSISSNATLTMTAGNYRITDVSASGNSNLIMATGLYFIDGGSFSVSGNANLAATNVTIYVEDGDFNMSGNGVLAITAPTTGPYAGMMLWMGPSNVSTITLSGNSSLATTGTIYGPLSYLSLSGNGSATVLNAQFIVNTVGISGNGTFTQNFDEDSVFGGSGGNGTVSLDE